MSAALRLLAVLAHPDDETLGNGGTIARYAREGVDVHLVTATRGERGRFRGEKDGPDHPGSEALARLREAELQAAAQVLGVRSVEILGYGDGVLDRVPAPEAIARIAAAIRRVRPQVVITFGPEGAYGHPDHIAICQLTTGAIVAAADPAHDAPHGHEAPFAVSKLYYMAWTNAGWQAYQHAFKRLVSLVDGVEREAQPLPDWQITTWIDTRAEWQTVWRAVQCHDSQVAAYRQLAEMSPEDHEALWGVGTYYRVFSTVNGGRERERDLFEGLRDETPRSGRTA